MLSARLKLADSVCQHRDKTEANALSWQTKPLLRIVYRDFYKLIQAQLASAIQGRIVELGAGLGAIKDIIPDCRCTDQFARAHLDGVENAYRLSFADQSLSNLILFDVFHHLRYPGDALRECHRALNVGGRLIIFEPALGWLGWLVYGCFHHEPLGLFQPITWYADDVPKSQNAYYAAQGNAHRVFVRGEHSAEMSGWRTLRVERLSALSYVASGGFSGPQLYPTSWYPLLRKLDRVLDRAPSLFATRMLIVLERE